MEEEKWGKGDVGWEVKVEEWEKKREERKVVGRFFGKLYLGGGGEWDVVVGVCGMDSALEQLSAVRS